MVLVDANTEIKIGEMPVLRSRRGSLCLGGYLAVNFRARGFQPNQVDYSI